MDKETLIIALSDYVTIQIIKTYLEKEFTGRAFLLKGSISDTSIYAIGDNVNHAKLNGYARGIFSVIQKII